MREKKILVQNAEDFGVKCESLSCMIILNYCFVDAPAGITHYIYVIFSSRETDFHIGTEAVA